ncbi:MAG TPA: hypothetical protein VHL11_07055 [Phototrophicaceae bacterium]|jgi:hypothetical protein|nr:hypothetical protein [Phototrophicaceae bacterium]
MFSDSFRKQRSPLQDDEIRAQLRDAILAHDSALFRHILEGYSPELASQERLYSVITLVDDKLSPILVDRTGNPPPPGYVIQAHVPIDTLNADIVGDELHILIGDQEIIAHIGHMQNHDANDDAEDGKAVE